LNEAKAFAMASVGVPKFTAIAIAIKAFIINYVSQVIQSEIFKIPSGVFTSKI
jgi:hypothetical protein